MIKTLDSVGISVRSYGWYRCDGYGTHSLMMTDLFGNTFWFSYDTLIAFRIVGEFHIIKNYWGTTTGKHLNWINNNKSIREDEETFVKNYQRCIHKQRERR